MSPIHHTLWLPRWNGADKGIAKAGDAYCHFGTLPGGWIKSLEGSPFPLYSEDGGTFPTWQPYSQECQLKPLLGPYLQVAFFPAPPHTLACVSSHSSGKAQYTSHVQFDTGIASRASPVQVRISMTSNHHTVHGASHKSRRCSSCTVYLPPPVAAVSIAVCLSQSLGLMNSRQQTRG